MQGQNVTRTLLFVAFFGIGAAAMGTSVLCDDLARYYRNKYFLKESQEFSDRLRSLNDDYDAILRRLEEDPNLIKRIAPATIGAEQAEPNTVYPRATAEQLAAAKKALARDAEREPNEPTMPTWLVRSGEPRMRILLFSCGAALILLSFACFGPLKAAPEQEE